MTNQELFNCCTDWKEPDWSKYSSLFFEFNKLDRCEYGEEEYVINADAYRDTRFVTVYARLKEDGTCTALTDIEDCGAVNGVLAHLLKRSGLPLE